MATDRLRLVPTPETHLATLMTWFATLRGCREWGGPSFRFPFDADTFREDTRYPELPSYSLIQVDDGRMLGFGQYYRRADRCHLARLAIAPAHRGRRFGVELVTGLVRIGCDQLGVAGCSLFVLTDNTPAHRLYERLGFAAAPWPEDAEPLAGCIHMVREPIDPLRAHTSAGC